MKTIIFDFDGTIANSFDFVLDFLVLKAKRKPLVELATRNVYRNISMLAIARNLDIPWYRMPLVFLNGRKEMARALATVQPVGGMLSVIKKLHSDGYTLFIVSTNSKATINSFLDRHDISDHFSGVMGGVGLFGKAPALKRLVRAHKIDARNCIYVGDETRDVEASTSVGMESIAVTWGFASEDFLAHVKPTAIVHSAPELLKALTLR